jgi:Fe-S cluster assembly protein SufD
MISERLLDNTLILSIASHATRDCPIDLSAIIAKHASEAAVEKLQIIVGAGADVVLHDTPDAVITKYEVHIASHASVEYVLLYTQSMKQQQIFELCLDGEYARIDLRGLYVLQDAATVDIVTVQRHTARNGTSNVLFKGLLQGASRATYRGTIVVDQQGDGTRASQHNKHIMLSDRARAWSMPSLEVKTNNVRCAHGTATGTFDEHQLFYLQSRGLDPLMAKKLLIEGFCADVIYDPQSLASIISTLFS